MNHCDEGSWKATEFEPIGQHIDRPDLYDPPRPDLFDPQHDPDFFKPGFKEWLFRRPLLWRRFVSSALRAAKHKDAYDFSALTLVLILLFQSTEDDPYYLRGFDRFDYCFVPELGYLLMALYPETAETLVNGESWHASRQVADVARFIEYLPMNLPAFLDSKLVAMHDIPDYQMIA